MKSTFRDLFLYDFFWFWSEPASGNVRTCRAHRICWTCRMPIMIWVWGIRYIVALMEKFNLASTIPCFQIFPLHQNLFVIQCRHHQINSTCYHVGESPSFVALMGKFYSASMFPLHLRFLDASMHLYERVCLSVCLSVGLSVRNAFVSNTRKRVISAFEVEGMSRGERRT